MYGGEAPAIPPQVVVLLAGYNNARYVRRTDPAELMDWILQVAAGVWGQAAGRQPGALRAEASCAHVSVGSP